MIYDCFIFFNEFDLLEIRLNELDNIVDKFVLVEANFTHSSKEKPYYGGPNSGIRQLLHRLLQIKCVLSHSHLSNIQEIFEQMSVQLTKSITGSRL